MVGRDKWKICNVLLHNVLKGLLCSHLFDKINLDNFAFEMIGNF